MRIEWSSRADADLDWIEDYIAQDNPIAALETRERIERQVKLLKQQPRMGRKGRVRGTREIVITTLPYIVTYRVKRETVQIARVRAYCTARRCGRNDHGISSSGIYTNQALICQ